jgi:hypothetical protein
MTTADVQQLQYALSKAQERIEELSALLKASNASNDALVEMVLKHEATIATLRAQVAAVPVNAIIAYYRLSAASPDALAFWEDNQRPFEQAEDAMNAWIKAMRATVTEVTP